MKTRRAVLLDLLTRLFPEMTREQLYSRVLCGEVVVDGGVVRDPKATLAPEAEITLSVKRFVSRGGFKLDPVIDEWALAVNGKVFVDAGSSTGGFTDVLLQRGARMVHAVDVGTAQLDWKLRTDPRVKVHENTNIMAVGDLDPAPNAAVADLSFRSLRGAARKILDLTSDGWLIALVKPQFEWLDAPPDFHGVVTPESVPGILAALESELRNEGVRVDGWSKSAIRGRKGNQEYLALLRNT